MDSEVRPGFVKHLLLDPAGDLQQSIKEAVTPPPPGSRIGITPAANATIPVLNEPVGVARGAPLGFYMNAQPASVCLVRQLHAEFRAVAPVVIHRILDRHSPCITGALDQERR
jgi:hypothetical protein